MSRQQAIVIGLGQFGMSLARSLAAGRMDVLAIDQRSEAVQAISGAVAEAACFDAMNEEALARTAPANRDVCICAIGDESREGAIIVTALLRQLGARRVIARASDDLQARILRLVGAHEVVNPERAFGERLAARILYQGILDEIPLGDDLVISEVVVPPVLVGHSLAGLELPRRFEVNVLGIRRGEEEGPGRVMRPQSDTELRAGDVLILVAPPGGARDLLESCKA